jgi:4'-phosphopantetheinyl transferase
MRIDWAPANEPVILHDFEAHVWAVPLIATSAIWDECWASLAADERRLASDFQFSEPRRRFVVARVALRRLMARYLDLKPKDVSIQADRQGKPRLASEHAGNNLHFNVSHSGDLALIAVCNGCEVGVDVEQLREVRQAEQIAKRFFHPLETQFVLAATTTARSSAFLRCWTGKEAALKAVGMGITGTLSAFCVPTDSDEGWIDLAGVPQRDLPSRCWLQRLSPCDGYVAAVASVEEECQIRCFAFSLAEN